jgi:hypothetical protein
MRRFRLYAKTETPNNTIILPLYQCLAVCSALVNYFVGCHVQGKNTIRPAGGSKSERQCVEGDTVHSPRPGQGEAVSG